MISMFYKQKGLTSAINSDNFPRRSFVPNGTSLTPLQIAGYCGRQIEINEKVLGITIIVFSFCGLWVLREALFISSATNIAGINIGVGLVHNHAFIAEYKRYVLFDENEKVHLGDDTGGYAYINLFELENKLILQTFWPKILVIDKKSKKYVLEERPLENIEVASFVGKFHFMEHGKYGFTSKEKDPKFIAEVMKGGQQSNQAN